MTEQVHIRIVNSKVHILVPWNALHGLQGVSLGLPDVRVENAPSVFLPVCRG